MQREVLVVEKERLDLSDQMEKYLDSFDGYLYAGNESSYCPIRAGMELLGKEESLKRINDAIAKLEAALA